jgi:hypothetical protein
MTPCGRSALYQPLGRSRDGRPQAVDWMGFVGPDSIPLLTPFAPLWLLSVASNGLTPPQHCADRNLKELRKCETLMMKCDEIGNGFVLGPFHF